MKNWKNLFIKTDETDQPAAGQTAPVYSFPAQQQDNQTGQPQPNIVRPIDQGVMNEVIAVYEKGIDSINMPGYDFYEFYRAIQAVSGSGDQTYSMAFRMACSMDSSLTAQKLLSDAEFYISKINEVHNQYSVQGQQKLNAMESKKNEEKNLLLMQVEQAAQQVTLLRNQLQALESDISQKRLKLSNVDNSYLQQESAVRQKLLANDHAKEISIAKLSTVKEGIQKYIK